MRVFVVYAKDDPACTRKFFDGTRLVDIEESVSYGNTLGLTYGVEDIVHEAEFTDHPETFVKWLNEHAGAT